jgi:RND family efflux transporter MFP subunit
MRFTRCVTSSLLLLSVVLFFLSCAKREGMEVAEPKLRAVRTIVVQKPDELDGRELPGEIDAVQKADISFRVSGKVQSLLVKPGDEVKKGQLLSRLDDTDAKIALQSRQAEYDQVDADYLRGQQLVEQGVISRSEFDRLAALRATAQGSLESAKQNLEYTYMRAPFSGMIAKRYVDRYEEVNAFEPVFTLQDLSSFKIKTNVPESIMIQAKGRRETANLWGYFDADPSKRYPLKILEISSRADEETNTFELMLSLDPVEGLNILPGMNVIVVGEDLSLKLAESAFLVPAQSVIDTRTQQIVYVAVPTEREGVATIEERQVQTGRLSLHGLEILHGLQVGDIVVIAGMSKMYEGLEVRIDQTRS